MLETMFGNGLVEWCHCIFQRTWIIKSICHKRTVGFLQNLHSYVLQQCLFLQQCFIESGLGPKGNLNWDNLVSKSVMFSKETLQHMLCCQIQAHIKQAAVFYYKTGPIKAAYNSDTTHNSPINIYLIPGEIHCLDILQNQVLYIYNVYMYIYVFFALEYRHLMTFVPSFNRVKFLRCNMSHVKWLPCFPTLTDGLRAAPGAVVKAGPLGWANQTVSRLAAKTQQALGFKFFPSQTSTVGRHPRVSADSWTYTYIYMRHRVNDTNQQRDTCTPLKQSRTITLSWWLTVCIETYGT